MDTPGGSYTPPPPPPPPPATEGAPPPPGGGAPANSDRTIFLILSYLGLLSLIPLLTKKDDPEIQWHAKNGVTLMGAAICWGICQVILGFVPVLGCAVHVLGCAAWVGFLILTIVCIVKAVQGVRFRIPVVTDLSEKIVL
jgi:uncharacterized membrane protein